MNKNFKLESFEASQKFYREDKPTEMQWAEIEFRYVLL